MKRRYSIWVREYGSDHDVELLQVDSNPGPVMQGLKKKMLTIRDVVGHGKKSHIPKYTDIRMVENF